MIDNLSRNKSFFIVTTILISTLLLFLYVRKASLLFDHGIYSFNDVTYLNDVVSNAIYLKKPFYVSQLNSIWFDKPVSISHIFLVPIYLLTESQFIIVFLPILSMILSLLLFGVLIHKTLERLKINQGIVKSLSVIIPISLLSNSYFESVIFSAHPEVYTTFFLTLLCYFILNNKRMRYIVPLLIFTLGLRIDVAIFTSITLSTLLLLKPFGSVDIKSYRKRIFTCITISLFYFSLAYFFFFNSENLTNELNQYGSNPYSIIFGVLTSPSIVLAKLKTSAFVDYNNSFYFFHFIIAPYVWVINSISASILFLSNDPGKTLLWDYQSAILIPGIFISFIAGINNIKRLLVKSKIQTDLNIILASILFCFSLTQFFQGRARNLDLLINNFAYNKENKNVTLIKKVIRLFETNCPEEKLFATDPQISPFLKLSYQKVLINNFDRANIAISFGDINPVQKGSQKAPNSMWETKEYDEDKKRLDRSKDFNKVFLHKDFNIYIRKNNSCLKKVSLNIVK